MAEENNTYSIIDSSFIDLVEKTPIRIPKIQRDYAQGRENEVAKEIRTGFIHDLIQAIKHGEGKQLDFVYGSYEDGAFEPLDGQQRLTTLFLLHWYFGFKLFIADEGKVLPFLSYETRTSAEDFCRELVQHDARQFKDAVSRHIEDKSHKIKAAEERVNAAKDNIRNLSQDADENLIKQYQKELEDAKSELSKAKSIPDISISSLIKNRDWFSYLWKFDPTIQSMLVMIDSIHKDVTVSEINTDQLKENLNKITFSNLNLGDFGLSDELFIKMNARGKQLSSFDILKSTLEEEIQIQKEEHRCTDETETLWRSMIDGQWIDWFWNLFAAKEITDITEPENEYSYRLALAKRAEDNLKRLILRIIALQILNYPGDWDELMATCYNDNADNLEGLMSIYNDKFRALRLKESGTLVQHEINFDEVIKDICCLYYKVPDGSYKTIFDLVSHRYRILPEALEKTSLSFILDDTNANDRRIIFYSLLRYARLCPIQTTSEGEPTEAWVANFNEWAHFSRNIFLNDNNNTRIDKPARFSDALKGVNAIIADLDAFLNSGGSDVPEGLKVRYYISSINKYYTGIDNSSLDEEKDKATLKLADPAWAAAIDEAESTEYLWGQIRCLIKWEDKDISRFREYSNKLKELIELKDQDQNLFYAGILSNDSSFGFKRGSFCEFNKDRDNSIRRYLRDFGDSRVYAKEIKTTLDKWIQSSPGLSAQVFLEKSINDRLLTEPRTYHWCILSMPSILDDASNKKVFEHKGHYIIAQKKTIYSHCYDIALLYVYYKIEGNENYKNLLFFDSVAETYQHAISFEANNEKILIKQADQGQYILSRESATEQFSNEIELLDYMFNNYAID